jgi:hypothetical protein
LRTPKPTVAASNEPSSNGSSRRSPCTHSIAGSFRRRALQHPGREVEADHLAGARLAGRNREIARAAAAVEHAIAGRDDLAHGQAAPALVEPDRS